MSNYKEDIVKHEFEFDNGMKLEKEVTIQYKQVDNGHETNKKYQTIISLPFSIKSSWTKKKYEDERERALSLLNPALKSKYNDIKLRDYNNHKKFIKFKEIVNLRGEELKHEYSYGVNHRENFDKIGNKTVVEIRDELQKLKKETSIAKIDENFTFELTFEHLINMLIDDNCTYCGVSIKQIKELSIKEKLSTKRSRGYTLEIDQKNPYGGYKDKNCVACCYWCNNAKTDEFTVCEFKEIAKGINTVWKCRDVNIIDFEKIIFWQDIKDKDCEKCS